VFNWLMNISACHLRFFKILDAQNINRQDLLYRAPLQPYLTWYGLIFNALILITSGFTVFFDWSTSAFFSSYISLILWIVLYIEHKLIYRTKFVPLSETDLKMR
ncbi:hypothetical protein B0J13DRAFT_460798, partial [Dactylonectria estremocensis]